MKACVKAWPAMINPATGKVYSDTELCELGVVLYGPVREVSEMTHEIAEEMAMEFDKLHPDYKYDQMQILTE